MGSAAPAGAGAGRGEGAALRRLAPVSMSYIFSFIVFIILLFLLLLFIINNKKIIYWTAGEIELFDHWSDCPVCPLVRSPCLTAGQIAYLAAGQIACLTNGQIALFDQRSDCPV